MSIRRFTLALPLVLAAAAAVAALAATDTAVHGVQVANIDATVRPGDDFNLYANGAWLKTAVIPPDQASWGSFPTLRDKAAKRTADLIEDLAKKKARPGSDEARIADFYASYMDEAGIEAKGIAGLKSLLARIDSIHDPKTLSHALGEQLRADVDPLNNTNFLTENLFGLWTGPGFSDPGHYTAYILQGGLGLPDRQYYLAGTSQSADTLKLYQAHIAKLFTLAGIADADTRAAAVVALETKIAQAQLSREESEDILKANNHWTRADFTAKAPGIRWDAFFAGASLTAQKDFYAWQAKAVTGISAVVAAAPIGVMKDYLAFHALNHFSPVLPKAFADERFDFYGHTLSGTPQQAPRWKRAVAATNTALGWAVGKLYVARYFPPAYKAEAETMVKNITAAFGRRIDALEWMSPETKARAKAKLASLYVGIGYPEKWTDYSAFRVVRGDALGNVMRSEDFEYARNIKRLGKPVDRSDWCMTPQTVNAVNLPLQNALNFPAAIMDPPFFDAKADSAFNYGAIGSVIGHEISHSFDDSGSQFDARGQLLDWWTKADFAHFQAAGDRLAEQYSAYAPFPDLHVNGKQTLGENIADVAGIAAALDGWRASLGGMPAPTVDGYTGEQRFFLAYAQTRQQAIRAATLRQLIITDGHAPSMYRAQAVRNIDAWYDAFKITPDQGLYLTPEKRVRVW